MNALLVISLDFELFWGSFDKSTVSEKTAYLRSTRRVIPEMLALFAEREVHVTWATVGFLFFRERTGLMESRPSLLPTYDQAALSPYAYIDRGAVGVNEAQDPFHFGGSLVDKIVATPHQELASHTFAHYYSNEPGQTLEQFRADLRAAQAAAEKHFGRRMRSLVFPRNQFNESYLRACRDEGFTVVRDNPRDWFWKIGSTQRESWWKRFNRGLDAYAPVGKKNTFRLSDLEVRAGLPLCLPASRLLRPYARFESALNGIRIHRVCSEMEQAARDGEVYHLWWHPHNFGGYPRENLDGLRRILDHYDRCREKYGMQSRSMGEVAAGMNPK